MDYSFRKVMIVHRKGDKLIIVFNDKTFSVTVYSHFGKPFAQVVTKDGYKPITLHVNIEVSGGRAVIKDLTIAKIDEETLERFDTIHLKASEVHKLFLEEVWGMILGNTSKAEQSGIQTAKGNGINQIQGNNNIVAW